MKGVLLRLEPVLSNLNAKIDALAADVGALKIDVAKIEGGVSQAPSALQLVAINFTTIVAVFALSLALVRLVSP